MTPDEIRGVAARVQPHVVALALELQLDTDLSAMLMRLVIEDVMNAVERQRER